MKGVVFCEFLDFVEAEAGADAVDAMIARADPPSGGVYTAVGRYDFAEMAALVGALSALSGEPAPVLLRQFGRHLFHRLAALHPEFVESTSDPLDLITSVETVIHVEVKKLYPDAELPKLTPKRRSENEVELDYVSCRPLGELCVGLIEGCADYYGATLTINATPTPDGLAILVTRQLVKAA